jgi:hypothetical protein
MSTTTQLEHYLVLMLNGATFAVPATRVQQCLSLPRLTALDDTAPWVVGAFDLHGDLMPVISLDVYLNGVMSAAQRGDLVVALKVSGHPVGLRADGVLGVEPAAPAVAVSAATVKFTLPGGDAWLIAPEHLSLSASDAGCEESRAEERLRTFERALSAADLQVMEARAMRYSGLLAEPTDDVDTARDLERWR